MPSIPTRSSTSRPAGARLFPQTFDVGFRDFVHAAAYDGYNAVHHIIRHPGSWLHARRYYLELEPSDPRAVETLAFVRSLYADQRETKNERERLGDRFSAAEVVRMRQSRAGPILASVLRSVCARATRHRHPWSYLRDVLDQLAGRPVGDDVRDLLPEAWAIRDIRINGKIAVSDQGQTIGSSTGGDHRSSDDNPASPGPRSALVGPQPSAYPTGPSRLSPIWHR